MSEPQATLRVLSGSFAPRRHAVSPGGVTLGRTAGGAIPNHIEVADATQMPISRQHAHLSYRPDTRQWWLELRSRHNPIWLDEQELGPLGQRTAPVANGAVIRLKGKTDDIVLLFEEHTPDPPAPVSQGVQRAAPLDPELLEDIEFSIARGQRRRESLGDAVARMQQTLDALDDTLRRADHAGLRAAVEDQLEPREDTLRDIAERLGGVGDALDDALELLARVRRAST